MCIVKIDKLYQRLKVKSLCELLDLHTCGVIDRLTALTKAEIANLLCFVLRCHKDMKEENLDLMEENMRLREERQHVKESIEALEKKCFHLSNRLERQVEIIHYMESADPRTSLHSIHRGRDNDQYILVKRKGCTPVYVQKRNSSSIRDRQLQHELEIIKSLPHRPPTSDNVWEAILNELPSPPSNNEERNATAV